jgi:hypothetical protein
MVFLCEKLNVSGDILFLCSSGLDDRRSARPMTGDGRKRGGMWSFDVKLSRAPECSCSCDRLQLSTSKWLVWNFAGAGDDSFGFCIQGSSNTDLLSTIDTIENHHANYKSPSQY